jgi:predicted lipid-binding transport protein (Tim44 family)
MIHLHLAAAGGGSGGFGGGGGEGGGGGRGAGLYIVIEILLRVALLGHGVGALFLIGALVLWILFRHVAPRARAHRAASQDAGRTARRKTAQRQRRVELAAAEAAEDDPAFAPDIVKPAAAELFTRIQHAWDDGDRATLKQLVAPELEAEWERRLDDFGRRGWRNRTQLLGPPTVDYVGLNNRGGKGQDRVTVRIEAKMRDYLEDEHGRHIKRQGRFTETVRVREFWTLTKNANGRWILASIEQGGEGGHALQDRLVATPWSDDQALKDEALVEQAVDEATPDGTKIAELADLQFEGDARAAALDLSLADGRFAPDILEVAARRAVAAWAEAVDGADAHLQAVATPDAARELLHPGNPNIRLVVRGPSVKQIRIVDLDAAAEPPTMTIELDVEGRRYIEDRNTTSVLAGSRSKPTTFTEHWTFALTGDAAQPWRIVRVGAPARL